MQDIESLRQEVQELRDSLDHGDECGWDSSEHERDALIVLIDISEQLAKAEGRGMDSPELVELQERLDEVEKERTEFASACETMLKRLIGQIKIRPFDRETVLGMNDCNHIDRLRHTFSNYDELLRFSAKELVPLERYAPPEIADELKQIVNERIREAVEALGFLTWETGQIFDLNQNDE